MRHSLTFIATLLSACILTACNSGFQNQSDYCKKHMPDIEINQPNIKNGFYYLQTDSEAIKIIDISHIREASIYREKSEYFLNIHLNRVGGELMRAFSTKNVGNHLSYFVDNKLITDSIIQAPLYTDFTVYVSDKSKAEKVADYTRCYLLSSELSE